MKIYQEKWRKRLKTLTRLIKAIYTLKLLNTYCLCCNHPTKNWRKQFKYQGTQNQYKDS